MSVCFFLSIFFPSFFLIQTNNRRSDWKRRLTAKQLPVVNLSRNGREKKQVVVVVVFVVVVAVAYRHKSEERVFVCVSKNNKLIRPIRALLLARHFRSPSSSPHNNNTRSPQRCDNTHSPCVGLENDGKLTALRLFFFSRRDIIMKSRHTHTHTQTQRKEKKVA